ncbi:hypothetical protein, partial [Roseiconus lacunae]
NGGVQRAGTIDVVMAINRASPASLQHMVRRGFWVRGTLSDVDAVKKHEYTPNKPPQHSD